MFYFLNIFRINSPVFWVHQSGPFFSCVSIFIVSYRKFAFIVDTHLLWNLAKFLERRLTCVFYRCLQNITDLGTKFVLISLLWISYAAYLFLNSDHPSFTTGILISHRCFFFLSPKVSSINRLPCYFHVQMSRGSLFPVPALFGSFA